MVRARMKQLFLATLCYVVVCLVNTLFWLEDAHVSGRSHSDWKTQGSSQPNAAATSVEGGTKLESIALSLPLPMDRQVVSASQLIEFRLSDRPECKLIEETHERTPTVACEVQFSHPYKCAPNGSIGSEGNEICVLLRASATRIPSMQVFVPGGPKERCDVSCQYQVGTHQKQQLSPSERIYPVQWLIE